jgi:phosphocarrier protein FPr
MSLGEAETVARALHRIDTDRPVLIGRPGSPGVGVGRSLRVEPMDVDGAGASAVDHPAPDAGRSESDRLRAALDAAGRELDELAAQTTSRAGEDVGAIFVAQALFAKDPGIVDPALTAIAEGVPAAEAILTVTERHADSLASVDDDYFRERAADVRDVGRRVAARIRGERQPDLWHPDGHPAVLVATDLDPSAVATLRRELVAGIALAGGTPTGHAAIVARALGIPMVLGLGAAVAAIPEATEVAIDGTAGRVVIDPGPETVAALRPTTARPHALGDTDREDSAGSVVQVFANVASPLEAEAAAHAGADGIGLVRTELLFLGRHTAPGVDEQRATYARIRSAIAERPVVFRTLDVGGDKPASWHGDAVEANPALGVRGIRLGQRQPDLLDGQLRALVDAAGEGELRVMFPMVAAREELDDVRARLDAVVGEVATTTGHRPAMVHVGVMIEVPSAAVMADSLAEAADFFSIGTNDLVQYTMAADRTNPELVDLASALQPAVLRLIDGVVRAAHARGRHVAVCGEAAGDVAVIPLLIGIGVDELSVAPASIETVRGVLATLDPGRCAELAASALRAGSLREVRALLD